MVLERALLLCYQKLEQQFMLQVEAIEHAIDIYQLFYAILIYKWPPGQYFCKLESIELMKS